MILDKKSTYIKTKERLLQLVEFLREKNFIFSVFLFFLIYIVFDLFWTPTYSHFLEKYNIVFMLTPNDTIMKQPLYLQISLAVILSPLLETLVTQEWLYKLLTMASRLKKKKFMIAIIGGLVFGSLHFYSLSYMVYHFFIGFLYMSAFIIKIDKEPYWTVVVLHGLINLLVILT